MAANRPNRYLSSRPMLLGLSKLILLSLGQLPYTQAAPLLQSAGFFVQEEVKPAEVPNLWLYLGVAAALVLLGGAFAGLTIALMGQDEMYLEVIRQSGEGAEKRHAAKVLGLLQRGKHWVLVTLLLGNVITNETLPIVLDRSLGGGWPAVLGSTVLIVIFGEIAPQSVCVRYGLPIGSWMSPFVLILMYILAPVSWPTAKFLDYLLGEEHGTVYKKAGLKTLVSLHKSMGEVGQQLNADEVTIISAVLDLKDKAIGAIMTPMDDVFTLSLDDVLDQEMMDDILLRGYSRIPVHHPDSDGNFVGMLLVKMLITYDPEDAKPVRDFALATLPETRPDTSCLDIINFFQEGKSHMIMLSEYPGEDHGAIGVVTLEDVIEELIGEEIVDESDVFIDVHKAIRRSMPAPRMRVPRGQVMEEPPTAAAGNGDLIDIGEHETLDAEDLQRAKSSDGPPKHKQTQLTVQRRSSATSNSDTKPRRAATDEMKDHLMHLGPSNLASRPKATRINTVRIKPGAEAGPKSAPIAEGRMTPMRRISQNASDFQGGIGEGVLPSGGKLASDGVQALHAGYGSLPGSPNDERPTSATKGVQAKLSDLLKSQDQETKHDGADDRRPKVERTNSHSTVGSLTDDRPQSKSPFYHYSRGPARSGSITENVIDTNGIRKVVLNTTSSSDSIGEDGNSGANKSSTHFDSQQDGNGNGRHQYGLDGPSENGATPSANQTKKKRRKKRKHGTASDEHQPLLDNNH